MRNIHPDLLDCLRRPNPYTELVTEISAPDASDVLRRPDQFTDPANLISQTPANSLSTSSRGPLQLASASTALAAFTGETGGLFNLHREDPNKRLKGVGWELDKDFVRAVLRTVTAKIYRGVLFPAGIDFELQIFRVTRTPGLRYKPNSTTGTPWNVHSFTPLLSPAPVRKWADLTWVGGKAELSYDLTSHGLVIENTPEQAVSPDQTGELPKYYFVVRPVNMKQTEGEYFGWLVDTATARTIAGIGTFKKTYWARNSGDDTQQWQEDTYDECPYINVTVEQFQASSEAVYALDLTKAPAAGTTGRVMFERLLPPGTAASLALSTAGATGPWTAVKHGDVVATAQQTYHLKLNIAADAALRSSPGVTALGVEFRKFYDVTAESVVEFPTREISLPWLEASIAEAKLKVLRLGVRDYLDVASTLGSTESPAKLEVDIYLASRHPVITRDKWLRLERLLVETRTPSPNAEEFRLLSYGSKLKRKIPEQKETISSVHTVVAGSTAAAVLVSADLPGASDTGNEYDNKQYYMRVQATTVDEFSDGHVQEIAGNTGRRQLDFSPALPAAPAAGDVIEVHSGIYATQAVTWQDADFADIWWELLTTHIGIPPERIGLGSLPRGGRPPTVADRAPGDATAQAKLKGTFRMSEQESGDEALDQVSFHMGGATVEIDGQICFIQIYPLRSPNGAVTVPLPPVSRVFDGRDYSGLAAAPGLEKRATVLSAKYGKNAAAANPDAYPEKTSVVIDNDAFGWLARTDLEDLGTSELPEKIRRWIYNSTDTGLQLATDDAGMVVRATSTGLRVWPFSVGDAQPEVTLGDAVVVITDQYTDYDPASGVALKGWLAVRGVVVRTGGMGRSLAIFVPGLTDNVTQVKDGTGDDLSLGDAPEKPTVTVGFNSSGQPTLNIDGRDRTTSLKVEVEKIDTPTDEEVEATTALEGAGASVSVLSPTWAPGEILYGKAFAYAGSGGTGRRSEATVFSVPREGTGKAAAPIAAITRVGDTIESVTRRYTGTVGLDGAGPIEYQRRIDIGGVEGAWSAWAVFPSGGGTYAEETIARHMMLETAAVLQLRDANGILSDFVWDYIRSRHDEVVAARSAGSGRGLVDAALRRFGLGGVFTRAAAFVGFDVYDRAGEHALINSELGRATADLDGPTGIGMDVVERGGNKGDQALDSSNILVGPSADFTRDYTGKNLANIPDDATSDRRAATADEKTGGSRGFSVIDSGLKVVEAGIDFVRSYTNKHMGNVPDDATTDRRAATANQKTGGDRGAAALDAGNVLVAVSADFTRAYTGKNLANVPDDATSDRRAATADQKTGGDRAVVALDAGGVAVAAAVDLSRGYTNKHLGNIPDDASSDRKAVTTNEKTGASRAYPALDASNRLTTGVTSAATADDGTQIESIKRSKIKAARSAGSGAQGLSASYARRTGEGGTVAAPFKTGHQYSADGLRPLIDAVTGKVLPDLELGSGVRGASDVAFGPAPGSRYKPNKHNEQVVAIDSVSKTFVASFESIPEIRAIPQQFTAPTAGNKVEFRATEVTVSGFTARAIQTSGSTYSSKTADFSLTLNGTTAASQTLSADGAAAYCDLPDANSNLTTYTAVFDVDTTGMGTTLLDVLVYRNAGASSEVWTLVGSKTYDTDQVISNDSISFDAALGVNYDVRVVLSYTFPPSANATVTVKRVDYQVVTSGTETSLTAGTGDGVLYQAVEKS